MTVRRHPHESLLRQPSRVQECPGLCVADHEGLATLWPQSGPKSASQARAAQRIATATRNGGVVYKSGGHGTRTRNPLRGTTFPVGSTNCPPSSTNARSRTRLRVSRRLVIPPMYRRVRQCPRCWLQIGYTATPNSAPPGCRMTSSFSWRRPYLYLFQPLKRQDFRKGDTHRGDRSGRKEPKRHWQSQWHPFAIRVHYHAAVTGKPSRSLTRSARQTRGPPTDQLCGSGRCDQCHPARENRQDLSGISSSGTRLRCGSAISSRSRR